jgi:hypothetical protein
MKNKTQKLKELMAKRDETVAQLEELYKHFHGVKHENSASEIAYTRIMVLEGFVESLNSEIKSLESEDGGTKTKSKQTHSH